MRGTWSFLLFVLLCPTAAFADEAAAETDPPTEEADAKKAGVLGILDSMDVDLGATFGATDDYADAAVDGIAAEDDPMGRMGARDATRAAETQRLDAAPAAAAKAKTGTDPDGHQPAQMVDDRREETTFDGVLVEMALMPDEDVRRMRLEPVVKRRMTQLNYCVEKRLRLNPKLHGKVVVEFDVTRQGQVVRASLPHSALQGKGARAAETCILNRFLKMRFPATPEGRKMTYRYPLMFQAR